MTRKFFGTDGIRGLTNSEPMTAETALRVGQAAGAHFLRGDHRHRVVIGKDTRLSGYMMESALVAGFASVGMDVVLLGPMPTPAAAISSSSSKAFRKGCGWMDCESSSTARTAPPTRLPRRCCGNSAPRCFRSRSHRTG